MSELCLMKLAVCITMMQKPTTPYPNNIDYTVVRSLIIKQENLQKPNIHEKCDNDLKASWRTKLWVKLWTNIASIFLQMTVILPRMYENDMWLGYMHGQRLDRNLLLCVYLYTTSHLTHISKEAFFFFVWDGWTIGRETQQLPAETKHAHSASSNLPPIGHLRLTLVWI